MGIYLNPDNDGFQESVHSKIYVDKTGLIAYTNEIIHTEQKFICVSRPRRFGKSMTLKMLAAYYSRGCDSRELFTGLSIENNQSFQKYLNKYGVIFLNMQQFLIESENQDLTEYLDQEVQLLQDTLSCNEICVAEGLDRAHTQAASILTYNDENSLSCAIGLAYYSARKDYRMIHEFPAGHGFADVVFLPLPHTAKPALVIELKYNKSDHAAIQQIKDRNYIQALEGYHGEILLIGINYNKKINGIAV